MANTFKYKITADDETAKGIASAEKNFKKLSSSEISQRKAVAKAQGEQTRAWVSARNKEAKEAEDAYEAERKDLVRTTKIWEGKRLARRRGLDEMVGGLGGGSLSQVVGGLTKASGAAELLEGSVGKAALGFAGFAGLAVSAGVAAYQFSKGWINAAANLDNLRASLGMTAKDITGFENAGAQFGVDKGAMDQSLAGIGGFAFRAKFDPNAVQERALIQKTGLKINYDKNGNADVTDLAYQFAELSKNQRNVYGLQQLAQIGGFSAALPAFRRGRAGLQSAVANSLAVGGSMTDADTVAGAASRQADVLNQQGLQHVVHLAQKGVAQPVMGLERLAAGGMAAVWGSPSASGPKSIADFHSAVTGIFVPAAKSLEDAAGHVTLWAKQEAAMRYFISQGRTPAQAAGMVANITRESGFVADRVGDSGKAFSYGQWHPDRQAAFAAKYGHDMRHASKQELLAFYNDEMYGGSESRAGVRLSATTTAFDAGAVVSRYDERPRDAAGEAQRRGELADAIYQAFSKAIRENPQNFTHDFKGLPRGASVTSTGGGRTRIHRFMVGEH